MAYSGEVLRRARERLAQARSEREAENAEHLRRAYRQVPRLAEIDRALRLTMAQAARTVFQQGGQAQAEFDRIRQENRALQAEREWLIEDNFEEGFLDDAPVCAVCGGTGYVGSQMCECLRELCRQAGVPCQTFFNRSDMVGGSTLGNLSNGQVALHTVDIGLPQLAMHSPYETAGVEDTASLVKAATAFYGADIEIRRDGCYRVSLGKGSGRP